MKSYALLNTKSGDLFEGRKCWVNCDAFDDIAPDKYSIAFFGDYDGWLIFHPNEAFGGHWVFFNRVGEEFFEVLGEL